MVIDPTLWESQLSRVPQIPIETGDAPPPLAAFRREPIRDTQGAGNSGVDFVAIWLKYEAALTWLLENGFEIAGCV